MNEWSVSNGGNSIRCLIPVLAHPTPNRQSTVSHFAFRASTLLISADWPRNPSDPT